MSIRVLPNSLKKQLLFYLLFCTLIVWGATAYISFKETQREVAKVFREELAQSAGVLHAFVESMLHEGSLSEHWDPEHASNLLHTHDLTYQYAGKIAFQLWSVDEGLILRSASAPKFALSSIRNGYSQATLDEHLWYVFSIANHDGEYIIHVGQREDVRESITYDVTRQLMQNFLIGLPILGMMIWFIVSHTLAPLNHLTKQLAKREAGYLKPLPINDLPEEIIPVVKELNTLFVQLEQAFENERNFTSDASHELRTPLAGLLTQVQVAQKTQDESVRTQALNKAQQAVQRMTRMVQQLLTLSRIQSQNEKMDQAVININQEIVNLISEIEPLAHRKNIDIEYQSAETLNISGNQQLIDILIRNLIENALKYSPQNGKVKIRSMREKNQLWLSVEDNGPGIKEKDRKRLTRRFFRSVETASTTEGSGLGLSIVQRIATLHDAEIHFSKSSMGGLLVLLIFDLPFATSTAIKHKRTHLFRKK
ncbi:ATP-binding protein [Methylomarinum sp. Ch1-1]|uniref:histidine kinase n=1 Tax=Methylomarinum roseum TaxID=3067653 RepID=A0AAU7NW39_9GAMM